MDISISPNGVHITMITDTKRLDIPKVAKIVLQEAPLLLKAHSLEREKYTVPYVTGIKGSFEIRAWRNTEQHHRVLQFLESFSAWSRELHGTMYIFINSTQGNSQRQYVETVLHIKTINIFAPVDDIIVEFTAAMEIDMNKGMRR